MVDFKSSLRDERVADIQKSKLALESGLPKYQ